MDNEFLVDLAIAETRGEYRGYEFSVLEFEDGQFFFDVDGFEHTTEDAGSLYSTSDRALEAAKDNIDHILEFDLEPDYY